MINWLLTPLKIYRLHTNNSSKKDKPRWGWIFVLFMFLFPFCAYAQNISTYAGNGITTGGYGDGSPATTAALGLPVGLNFDNFGNLLICHISQLVRKVDKSTTIITSIAGSDTASSLGGGGDGGPATCANIVSPYGVCVDKAGNYYIADGWYSEIRKVDIVTGIIDTFAGNRSVGGTGDGGPAKSARLSGPVAVCFDTAQKYLYISDAGNHRVRRVDMATGIISAYAGTGTNSFSGDGGPATAATFSRLFGMCMDANDNLYIGDWDNHRIRRVDGVTGIVTTIAGNGSGGFSGDGGPATNAGLEKPTGICFDKCGNLYFTDEDNNRVRRIDMASGIINTIAGDGTAGFGGDGGPALTAQFNHPTGIAVDSAGNMYIGDYFNYRVRKMTFPAPYVSISLTSPDTVCAGSYVTFHATAAVAGATPSYRWNINGVWTGVFGSSYGYIPANGDTVQCMLVSSSACVGTPSVVSNTIHMTVLPVITPAIALSGITVAPVGSLVTVTATVTNAGSSYNIKWFNNGVMFNTTAIPTVTYTKVSDTDHITAWLHPVSSTACYDSARSGMHTVIDTTTDTAMAVISMAAEKRVYIYPNPASDVIHIDGEVSDQHYRLLSVVGSMMMEGELQEGSNSIPIQMLPAGVYLVEVSDSSTGKRVVRKILKQ